MYFYHKVMSDVLSVNEKYRNVWRERGGEEVNTHAERHTHFTFQKGSSWPAVSCPAVIRIMVLAPGPGETDLPFPPAR